MFLPEFIVMVTYVKNLICSAAGYIPDKRTTGMNFPWKTASPILEDPSDMTVGGSKVFQ